MATTIRIRARNEARPELAGVVQDLGRVETAADGATASFQEMAETDLATEIHHLVAEMRANNSVASEQKVIVADLRKSWLQFTAETITNLRTVGDALGDMTDATIDGVRKVKDLADGSRAAATGVGLLQSAAVRGAASWTTYGAAIGSTLSVVGGLKLGMIALDAVLANTGAKVNELGEVETNLDRTRAATRDLMADITALGSSGASELKRLSVETAQWAYEASGLKAGWTEFDRQITERTGNWVINARAIGSAIRGVSRDAIDAAAAIDAAQEAAKDDFDRVRESNQAQEASAKSRAEAARIAGLTTTQAIDDELQKLKERRGMMAANNKFDADAQRAYLDSVEALERRRTQLLDERSRQEADARKKQLDAEREHAEWVNRQDQQRLKEHNDRIAKENEAYEKGLDEEVKLILEQQKAQQKAFEELTKKKAEEAKKQRDDYIARWREAVGEVANIIKGNKGGGQDQIQQIRDSLSQRDVAKIVGNRRRAEALEDFDKNKAHEWRQSLINQGVNSREADRRVEAGRNRVGNEAFSRGFGDVVRGRASQDEISDAQNRMVAAVNQQVQANTDLHPMIRQGFQQAAQLSIQATQEATVTRQMLEQTIKAMGAAGQKVRSINGSLR